MDMGVSVPFKAVKLPWKKEPLRLRFTMKRPTLGTQIRIAREFARLGVTHEELERQSETERLLWVGAHGRTVSRIVALSLCRGKWSGRWLTGLVAWVLRETVDAKWLEASFRRWTLLLGTQGFENTIALLAATNPLKPTMTSQEGKGS